MAKYRKKQELMTPRERELARLKMEVAEELGLGEKIKQVGWKNLTAREAGRIGGLVSRRLSRSGRRAIHDQTDQT